MLGAEVGALAEPEPHDARAGHARHRGDSAVVRVKHGDGTGRQLADQLGLRALGDLEAAEVAGVGEADLELDGDVRLHDGDQVGDVAEMVRAHLDDEVAGVVVDRQHGQRRADLVVERPLRGDGRAEARQDGPQHVLGRGLAVGAGDPDHRQRALGSYPADNDPRERGEGGHPVRHDDLRHGDVDRMLGDHEGRPVRNGRLDEPVAVGGLAGQGEEDGPLPHAP